MDLNSAFSNDTLQHWNVVGTVSKLRTNALFVKATNKNVTRFLSKVIIWIFSSENLNCQYMLWFAPRKVFIGRGTLELYFVFWKLRCEVEYLHVIGCVLIKVMCENVCACVCWCCNE